MRRRDFISLLGRSAVAWPLVARAQQPAKVPRIGFLRFGSASANVGRVAALRAGLRELGHVEGRNIAIEFRWADTIEQLPEHAAELVRMNVDVVFAMSSTEVEAVRQATTTIPIVFSAHADPVGLGHVASLARPGGNITGLTNILSDIVAKELEILKEAVPRATQIGVLFVPTAPSHRPSVDALETAGARLGIRLVMVPVRSVEDFDAAFATLAQQKADGFLVPAVPLMLTNRDRLAELGLAHRLPSMFGTREHVEAGSLMSYGANLNDLTRRAATYIDKILKGTKPADLPVEQPTRLELIINLKAARAIGVEVPPTLLARADEVIE
jgi:putative tryptophan/tyrosine transport system substrate-binding protein